MKVTTETSSKSGKAVAIQYISGLEKGRRNPTIVTVYELAMALGVTHIDLLRPDKQS